MPTSPPSLCTGRCGALVYGGGMCPTCLTQARSQRDKQRPNGYQRGYTSEWATFREKYLTRHPLCEAPKHAALPAWRRPTATDVDHTHGHSRTCPHKYTEQHLQALCHSCHSTKTATEDGGFTGRPTDRCT